MKYVAIKGMEMPKSCGKCPFQATFPNTGLKNGVCNDLHIPFKRHPHCPLVENVIPIPEGATNGDMIMTMFNCMIIGISKGKVYVEGVFFPFDEEWWNAPYRKVEE